MSKHNHDEPVKISIIVPIYNVENYLDDCLKSIRALCELVPAEVLLIDDGSTDRSSRIALSYARKNPAFHYYPTQNNGLGNARNFGVSHAKGAYLLFVDSDDVIVAETYAEMLQIAELSGSDITTCKYVRLKDTKTKSSPQCMRFFSGITDHEAHIKSYPNFIYDLTSWNKLFRRDFWTGHGLRFSDRRYYEDMPTIVKAQFFANKVSVCWNTGYLWRIRTSDDLSKTQRLNDTVHINDYFHVLSDVFHFLSEEKDTEGIKAAFLRKVTRYDMNMFFNRFSSYDNEKQDLVAQHIKNLCDCYPVEDLLPSFPAIYTTIYRDLMNGDYGHLIKVVNFRNSSYSNMPYLYDAGNDVMLRLPALLFDTPLHPAKADMIDILPKCKINSLFISEKSLIIQGSLFQRKVQANDDYPQRAQVLLIDGLTGYQKQVDTTAADSHELTIQHGRVVCHEDYMEYHYNYDKCGFRAVIDLEELDRDEHFNGNCYLLICHQNILSEGVQMVSGAGKALKKSTPDVLYTGAKSTISIHFDKSNAVFLRKERKNRCLISGCPARYF